MQSCIHYTPNGGKRKAKRKTTTLPGVVVFLMSPKKAGMQTETAQVMRREPVMAATATLKPRGSGGEKGGDHLAVSANKPAVVPLRLREMALLE